MDAIKAKLYSELRKTKQELLERLESEKGSTAINSFIEEELDDIRVAMNKIETGEFGKCEVSGELIPEELLLMIPTLKTLDDCQGLDRYYCKPIYS